MDPEWPKPVEKEKEKLKDSHYLISILRTQRQWETSCIAIRIKIKINGIELRTQGGKVITYIHGQLIFVPKPFSWKRTVHRNGAWTTGYP